MKLTIYEVARHRNGVCGEPFYAVRFRDHDTSRNFVATVFGYIPSNDRDGESRFYSTMYEEPHVAVLDADLVAKTVAFGENSWRGDRYASDMYDAIDAYEVGRDAELTTPGMQNSDDGVTP